MVLLWTVLWFNGPIMSYMGPSLHQLINDFVIWVAGPGSDVSVGIVDACRFMGFGGRVAMCSTLCFNYVCSAFPYEDLACDSGRPCEPNILGFASPLWREYWLVTGTGQYLPNFSIFLSTKCEPVWGRHGGDLTHTWERIPGAEKGVVYFVSGKLQACPNYALHLHPVDCSVVATQWEGNDMSKSWIELSNGASSPEYWILTPSNAPCPSKMLTAEAGTLRGTDFFRSPLTQWKIPGRDASPWPHRSSFLLLPQGSGCNASTAIEKEGLSNPSQCCDRAREQELQLMVSFGSFGTGSGRYDVCWGRTFGDGLNGGADSPLPASSFPIFVGVLSLLAPESLGVVQCTLGLPCFVTLYGLGLSALDSVVVHAGSSCEWPDLPPFDMEGAPDCSITGSDSYLKAELGCQPAFDCIYHLPPRRL